MMAACGTNMQHINTPEQEEIILDEFKNNAKFDTHENIEDANHIETDTIDMSTKVNTVNVKNISYNSNSATINAKKSKKYDYSKNKGSWYNVKSNKMLIVKLPYTAGTPLEWKYSISNKKVIKNKSSRYLPVNQQTNNDNFATQICGGSGIWESKFTGKKSGNVTIKFQYVSLTNDETYKTCKIKFKVNPDKTISVISASEIESTDGV